MWHYEYTVEDVSHRFEAESFDACLEALIRARPPSRFLVSVKIFEGGTLELGTGQKHYDAVDPVG